MGRGRGEETTASEIPRGCVHENTTEDNLPGRTTTSKCLYTISIQGRCSYY